MAKLIIALAEEIGDPDFFIGREQETAFYLDWAEGIKQLHSKSVALLSRRKMGKTALVQRLYNILYTRNDPRLIPFFFRIPEIPLSTAAFGLEFYQAFLSQYFGFLLRTPKLVNEVLDLEELKELAVNHPDIFKNICKMERLVKNRPENVWLHAQATPHRLAKAKDIRFVQIIDEFQYMNRFIYSDRSPSIQVDLCHSYMGLAESKYAPLFVTGSYIGWLTTILNHMTARFKDRELSPLTDKAALEAVYNYAGLCGRPVTEETAPYIAEVAYNDPFYISQIVRTDQPDLDLTCKAGVRDSLQFETTYGKGCIAKIWMEYIAEGLDRVNGINARKIVLYLAKFGNQEKTRDQIRQDLNLDLGDKSLDDRLFKLVKADLIGPGSSMFHFKGLGDPIFAVVFRKHYGPVIEKIEPHQITAEFEKEMKLAKRRESWQTGIAGEYRVMYFLLLASSQGNQPEDIIYHPTPGFKLCGFKTLKKKSIHLDQGKRHELDIHATSTDPAGMDLIAEVKVWKKPVSKKAVAKFIALKKSLILDRETAFLFYSENGFSKKQVELMKANGIMFTTFKKLSSGLRLKGQ